MAVPTLKIFLLFFGGRARVCWPTPGLIAHFVFLRGVWIRTPRAATNLDNHLSYFEDTTKSTFLAGQYQQ